MTIIFPPWYSRFLTLALRKLCYPTLPTDIFTTQNPGGHVIRSDQWVSPPDNPPTRKEKEREPGYEVNLNLLKRLPKLISCVFFLSRASWINTRDWLTASSFCCFDYECVSEYVEHVLTGKKNRPKQSLKSTKGFWYSYVVCFCLCRFMLRELQS